MQEIEYGKTGQPWLQTEPRIDAPDEILSMKGIYIQFNDNEIIYIGKTHKSFEQRVISSIYQRSCKATDIAFIPFMNDGDIAIVELLLINYYKPKYNGTDKYTDISELFSYDINVFALDRYKVNYKQKIHYPEYWHPKSGWCIREEYL